MPRKKGSTTSSSHKAKIAKGVKSYYRGGKKTRDGIVSNNEFPRDARGKKIGGSTGAKSKTGTPSIVPGKTRETYDRTGRKVPYDPNKGPIGPKRMTEGLYGSSKRKPHTPVVKAPTMTPELKAKADAKYNHIKKKYGQKSADAWERKQGDFDGPPISSYRPVRKDATGKGVSSSRRASRSKWSGPGYVSGGSKQSYQKSGAKSGINKRSPKKDRG